jgi:tetratricopeptide (TPR) repeat protein
MLGNRLHSAAKAQDCEKLYRSAIDKFRRAARIDNTICEAFFNLVNALFDLSIVKRFGAPEVMTRNGERLLQSAVTKYKRALEIYKAFPDAHNNLANALTDLARSESPKHEIRVLTEALSHYAIAAKTSDTPDVVYCNWGKALHELARRTRDRHAF